MPTHKTWNDAVSMLQADVESLWIECQEKLELTDQVLNDVRQCFDVEKETTTTDLIERIINVREVLEHFQERAMLLQYVEEFLKGYQDSVTYEFSVHKAVRLAISDRFEAGEKVEAGKTQDLDWLDKRVREAFNLRPGEFVLKVVVATYVADDKTMESDVYSINDIGDWEDFRRSLKEGACQKTE